MSSRFRQLMLVSTKYVFLVNTCITRPSAFMT